MKLLLYCTKGKPLFLTYGDCDHGDYATYFEEYVCDNRYYDYGYEDKVIKPKDFLNSKIVAECDFEVEDIYYNLPNNKFTTKTLIHNNLMKLSCLNHIYCENYLLRSIYDYTHNEETIGKAIHIKNLHIFDEPRELSNYYQYTIKGIPNTPAKNVQKAPQNMMRVFDWKGDKYILISIRPEWLFKILNGEKTIEVRRKVLKEM